jgi:hypothetical protein
MSIVYRTYLHTIMENNKVVFLCLILLLVLVVSNYVSINEGFNNKDISTIGKNMKKTISDVKNMKNEIKKNSALSEQAIEKTSTIDSKLENVTKINNSFETNASNYITKISGLSETVNKSAEANKQIQNEINTKVGGIDKQMETIKNNTDAVKQIKKDVEKIITEFRNDYDMSSIKLALNATQIPAKTQGFQNMNDPVLQASELLKKDMESAKLLAFTTIDLAYNGDLHLETPWTNSAGTPGTPGTAGITGTNSKEGFVDSTTANSAYVDPNNIFNLEKEVLTAFSDFNTKYYDVYQKCLHNKRQSSSAPNCGTSTTGILKQVYDAKNVLVEKIRTLNTAIGVMGSKSESTVGTDGIYVIAGKKVTEQQFLERHNQIKTLHNTITTMRSELDMKMANLLDKTKGPLPEAQNKYNFENYATIGWSILATSILYYTFVEMQ